MISWLHCLNHQQTIRHNSASAPKCRVDCTVQSGGQQRPESLWGGEHEDRGGIGDSRSWIFHIDHLWQPSHTASPVPCSSFSSSCFLHLRLGIQNFEAVSSSIPSPHHPGREISNNIESDMGINYTWSLYFSFIFFIFPFFPLTWSGFLASSWTVHAGAEQKIVYLVTQTQSAGNAGKKFNYLLSHPLCPCLVHSSVPFEAWNHFGICPFLFCCCPFWPPSPPKLRPQMWKRFSS